MGTVGHLGAIVSLCSNADSGFYHSYALSSLIRGMMNEDDFDDLMDRIEELPDEMHQLYRQMWDRLNGDEQRYRDEATVYFSHVMLGPLSLFEMLVALDHEMQKRYLYEIKPQDPAMLARGCKTLMTRAATRSAGLLEVISSSDNEAWSEQSNFDSSRSPSSVMRESYFNGPDMRHYWSSHARTDGQEDQSGSQSPQYYHCTQVKFLHRTARDFLESTTDGQHVLGEITSSSQLRFANWIRARIAALIQGLEKYDSEWLVNMLRSIAYFRSAQEKELLIMIKDVCKHFSQPDSPKSDIRYRRFWDFLGPDFEGVAAEYGCLDYICHLIDKQPYVSPYYLGFLILNASHQRALFNVSRNLSLVSWLAQRGADLSTKHYFHGMVENPATKFLYWVIAPELLRDQRLARQAVEVFRQLIPALITATSR